MKILQIALRKNFVYFNLHLSRNKTEKKQQETEERMPV